MRKRFVIEAVMIAVYGEMLVPSQAVEYLVPYTTISELYEMIESKEPVMPLSIDEAHVRSKISELIAMLEEPFNKKKLERALATPWGKSPPLPFNDNVSFTVVNAYDNTEYGEEFDPIETELILTSLREKAPIMTDQPDLVDRIIEARISVHIFDMDDFEFAVEEDANPV
ncbi:ADP-heptose synthase [Paenibacillus periandrae]|uniref:ADP-heptose synthase n=1 Tax=Paenibacillus periandrae TaxID=1761741 RepID=UPI001F08F05E|nr:ADP-heptose synthase [Paenibacillus periandrae]